ncbi:MAG: 16S rRNA (guanine(966)-N(2))-methyltransferase RsmD [Anaerolineaceae bacterium]
MANPRIIAGSARGIRIDDVPGDQTRPITDRVKEALFNIIGWDISEATFLDVFGGTGSVGIEALSRGASLARFYELQRAAVETIKKNLVKTKLVEKADVRSGDALAVLAHTPDRDFDYIFIAPPQYKDLWIKTLTILDGNPGWLAEDGRVIVQIDPVEFQYLALNTFKETDRRKYGSTLLVFYERRAG